MKNNLLTGIILSINKRKFILDSKLIAIVTLFITALFVTACDRLEVQAPESSGARILFTQLDVEQARAAFAKTLAKALTKKELRDFLKAEALKQFDEDYDVLFHAVKNQKVSGDTSFFDLLAAYHGSRQSFINVVYSLPKLNVLVPELLNEKYYNSAATWDTEHFIPKVATFETNNKKLEIDAYDSKGKNYKIKSKGDPDELILVVKDNERIEVSDQALSAGRISANGDDQKSHWDYLMADNGKHYYFSSQNYNKAKNDLRKRGSAGARIEDYRNRFQRRY